MWCRKKQQHQRSLSFVAPSLCQRRSGRKNVFRESRYQMSWAGGRLRPHIYCQFERRWLFFFSGDVSSLHFPEQSNVNNWLLECSSVEIAARFFCLFLLKVDSDKRRVHFSIQMTFKFIYVYFNYDTKSRATKKLKFILCISFTHSFENISAALLKYICFGPMLFGLFSSFSHSLFFPSLLAQIIINVWSAYSVCAFAVNTKLLRF